MLRRSLTGVAGSAGMPAARGYTRRLVFSLFLRDLRQAAKGSSRFVDFVPCFLTYNSRGGRMVSPRHVLILTPARRDTPTCLVSVRMPSLSASRCLSTAGLRGERPCEHFRPRYALQVGDETNFSFSQVRGSLTRKTQGAVHLFCATVTTRVEVTRSFSAH